MTMVYRTVLQLERKLDDHRFSSLSSYQRQHDHRKRSRRVLLQGILYSVALILLIIFPIITTLYWQVTGMSSQVLATLIGIVNPLQGFFNFLVYSIPVFQKCFEKGQQRKNQAEKNMILRKIIKAEQNNHDPGNDNECESTDSILELELELDNDAYLLKGQEEEEKEEIIPRVFNISLMTA
mmetsp:Transcript_15717/g.19959  ORF Transcript_15717/g.19959 Transcript_15717/m.19959 type:complete len:181 (-) Transcript_15717:35-577(-)